MQWQNNTHTHMQTHTLGDIEGLIKKCHRLIEPILKWQTCTIFCEQCVFVSVCVCHDQINALQQERLKTGYIYVSYTNKMKPL